MSLASLYNKTGLVIFSYPRADTPGCTTQACGYRDVHDEFDKLGYTVFGLSTDKPGAQMRWKTKRELKYSLLSDPDSSLLKALGATTDKKVRHSLFQVSLLLLDTVCWCDQRCHWVIEKGGKLLEAKIGVKPKDDPANALKFIQTLSE